MSLRHAQLADHFQAATGKAHSASPAHAEIIDYWSQVPLEELYSILNPAQKTAIARFLTALPKLVELDFQDQKIVPRALRNYWVEHLQTKPTE